MPNKYVIAHKLRQKNRIRRFQQQKGRCYYCEKPMYEPLVDSFDIFVQKLVNRTNYKPKEKHLKNSVLHKKILSKTYLCTSEHIHRKVEGGLWIFSNIRAACQKCNGTRGSVCHWFHKKHKGQKIGNDQCEFRC